MRSAYRALRYRAHTLPLYVDALLVEQFDHALSTAFASIAQHLEDSLKGWPVIFGEIAKYMYFSPLYVGVDLNARDKIYVELSCYLGRLFQSTGAVVIGEGQDANTDLFGTV